MSITPDDPRLTAYALGELSETEAAEVEAAMAADPAVLEQVEACHRMAQQLRRVMAPVAEDGLTAEQRGKVERAAGGHGPRARAPGPRRTRPWYLRTAAIAATVVLCAGLATWGVLRTTTRHHPMEPTPGGSADPQRLADAGTGSAAERRRFTHRDADATGPKGREEALSVDCPMPCEAEAKAAGAFMAIGAGGPRADFRRGIVAGDDGEGGVISPSIEQYDHLVDNPFRACSVLDVSTFSIDVDTASYANVRRFLTQGQLPPKGAVRIEELVNYFSYQYDPPPTDGADPFAANVEIAGCPWNAQHRLARVAVKGREMPQEERPASNLVFLLDVSGSMNQRNKLPLLKEAFKLLVNQLDDRDRVSIVVYAGAAGQVLAPTAGSEKQKIMDALDRLQAGGGTAGGAGIQLAYKTAREQFIDGGANRVILATDGDFNVGIRDRTGLVELIEKEAKSGVYLSILGFGMGNYKDGQMEELSNKGNGNYAYIDTVKEAKKVLVEQMSGTLVTIAKDVKIQVFFNPAQVAGWRLIGYENRVMKTEDFNDDTKDAGEIGAGHTVTALYELVPAGVKVPTTGKADPNPFVKQPEVAEGKAEEKPGEKVDINRNAAFRLRMRYKQPDGDVSKLLEWDILDDGRRAADASPDLRWAAAVAGFGMLLRESPYRGELTWAQVLDLAGGAVGEDRHGLRAEFIDLAEKASQMKR